MFELRISSSYHCDYRFIGRIIDATDGRWYWVWVQCLPRVRGSFFILQWAGVVYLVWIGVYKLFWPRVGLASASEFVPKSVLFDRAILINIMNSKAVISLLRIFTIYPAEPGIDSPRCDPCGDVVGDLYGCDAEFRMARPLITSVTQSGALNATPRAIFWNVIRSSR